MNFLEGGYIAGGLTGYLLTTSPGIDGASARFNGDLHLMPKVMLKTRLNFIDETDFGYDYAFGFEQAHALSQTIKRPNGSTTRDLRTYTIANTFSTQASLFYSYGAKDFTPRRYVLVGLGFGLGYADIVGHGYLTEGVESSSPTCYQAGIDLINEATGALTALEQSCELKSYRRIGVGYSGRFYIDIRYDDFYFSIDTRAIQLSSGKSLSLGTSGLQVNPAISAITVSYIYNL
ncbi:MAG: hypothetical protein OEZ43_18635 [Gammaproteobacteria bacterium]|nr:hypothetical protein [Gammaproteobacteria bacterium]